MKKIRHTYWMLKLLRDNFFDIPLIDVLKLIRSILIWWIVKVEPVDHPDRVLRIGWFFGRDYANIKTIWYKSHDKWVIPPTSFYQDHMYPTCMVIRNTRPVFEDVKHRNHVFWLQRESVSEGKEI